MIELRLANEEAKFAPRQDVSGELRWDLDVPVVKVSLNLLYRTSGKGTVDVVAVATKAYPARSQGTEQFLYTLPNHPYSFGGVLVTLEWAIEAVLLGPTPQHIRREIVVSPHSSPISLAKVSGGLPMPSSMLRFGRN